MPFCVKKEKGKKRNSQLTISTVPKKQSAFRAADGLEAVHSECSEPEIWAQFVVIGHLTGDHLTILFL